MSTEPKTEPEQPEMPEDQLCQCMTYPGTYYDQPEYCEDEAETYDASTGEWYCAKHAYLASELVDNYFQPIEGEI